MLINTEQKLLSLIEYVRLQMEIESVSAVKRENIVFDFH